MIWLPPWRKVRCPYCFSEVALSDCDVVSSRAGHDVLVPARARRRLMSRFRIEPITGEAAVRELASWRCPICGNLLPANSDRADMVVVGLIGGGAAGKTHYLTSLVQRLEGMADLQGVGCTRIAALNQEVVDRYQRDYHRVLFEKRERIPATPPIVAGAENRPLIYTLFFESRRGRRRYREVNLVLYDGSGEQMVIQQDMVEFHPYILHASGLILMVDPLSMPGVARNLPPYLRDVPVDAYAPVHLLQSVLTFSGQQRGLSSSRGLELPLAVTIAKSDLLRYIPRTLSVPTSLRRDSSYAGGYDPAEALGTSQEVAELFRRLGDPELVALTQQFAQRSYHAVSATGGPAIFVGGGYSMVDPVRCLDPLFWLLWKAGVIRGRTD